MDTNTPSPTPRLLRRPVEGRMVGGVALAIADYLGFDVTAVRIGFVVLALLGGLAVPLYLAGWLIIPEEGRETAPLDGWLNRTDLPGQH